jgi:D-alanine--poly(phosphoribitol) ligase subunit 2
MTQEHSSTTGTIADDPLQSQIIEILVTRMHLESPDPHGDLFEAGILDSLAFVDLLLHLEREFGFRCAPQDMELDHFRSVDRIARFVHAGAASRAELPLTAQ